MAPRILIRCRGKTSMRGMNGGRVKRGSWLHIYSRGVEECKSLFRIEWGGGGGRERESRIDRKNHGNGMGRNVGKMGEPACAPGRIDRWG